MGILIRSLIICCCFTFVALFFSSFQPGMPPLSPLVVGKTGRYLVKENGDPFFWLGDTGWNLFIRLNKEEVQRYLKDRHSKQYTVIQAHLLGWNLKDTNAYGDTAFLNNNFNSPNTAYWNHVDYIIQSAEDLGLYMALLPVWALSYTEKKSAKPGDSSALPLSKDTLAAYNYGRFLGNRYKEKKNIIWILGGDVWGTNDGIYDNLAKGLTESAADNDPGKILISFHPQGGTNRPPATSTSEFYHNKSWLDFNMIQSGHRIGNKNYERIAMDYATLPVKPTLESEPCYEQHPVEHSFKKGVFKSWNLRRRAYWSILAGGFGFTYGANGIWQMDKPGKIEKQSHHNYYWYDALNFEGGKQMTFVKKLMESRPYMNPERIPDQSMLRSENDGVDGHIQIARADDYSYLLAYSTNGSKFTVDLSKFPKKLNAWWYNPRDGKTYGQNNRVTNKSITIRQKNGAIEFDPPGEAGPEN
ncbi:MAG: apiosidase-like domain-containing protein, partial [Flavitalea sp.]